MSIALRIARACGLFAVARWLTRHRVRLLAYHGIWLGGSDHYGDCLFMSADKFAARMKWLASSPYRVMPLSWLSVAGKRPPSAVVLTIDDGWHGTFKKMVPVLQAHSMPATIYVTTYYVGKQLPVLNVLLGYVMSRIKSESLVCPGVDGDAPMPSERRSVDLRKALERMEALPDAEQRFEFVKSVARDAGLDLEDVLSTRAFHLMTPHELLQVTRAGIDIQLHTHTHQMHGMDANAVQVEIEKNRQELSRMLGVAPESLAHFCYPSGESATTVLPTLRACGISTATTCEYGLAGPETDALMLPRLLDCESMSQLQFEAHLSGFMLVPAKVKRMLQATRVALARRAGLRMA